MRKQLKMAAFAAVLAVGFTANAQTTNPASGNIDKGDGTIPAIRLIDNKGTIKYLQSNNGITTITSTAGGSETTTTWQLGGTLTEKTYITADATNTFALDGLQLVTDANTASTNTDAEFTATPNHDDDATAGTTGFTVLIRDEDSGALQKMRLSDLLQVQEDHKEVEVGSTAATSRANLTDAAANSNGIALDIIVKRTNIEVYRNGAKLRALRDYNIKTDSGTQYVYLVEDSSTGINQWRLYDDDIIEIHAIK